MRKIPHTLAVRAASGSKLPKAGSKISAAEHRVEGEAGEHEPERQRLQEHELRRL